MKKCKRVGCNNKCMLPSWKYCSDECNRLETNNRNYKKRVAKKNVGSIIKSMSSRTD